MDRGEPARFWVASARPRTVNILRGARKTLPPATRSRQRLTWHTASTAVAHQVRVGVGRRSPVHPDYPARASFHSRIFSRGRPGWAV